MLAELQRRKGNLKPTKTRNVSEELDSTICKDSDDYNRLIEDTHFEKYYETIKNFTFRSELFTLDKEQAAAIVEAYSSLQGDKIDYDWRVNDSLQSLAKQIDQTKKEGLLLSEDDDIFVRLSSRSPKDAAIGERGRAIYANAKAKMEAEYAESGLQSTEDNLKIHALYITGTEALRIKSGEEAVDLLVNSKRIQGDLERYLAMEEQGFNVVVREFANFEVELEFRGFVFDKKLTAITQYNQFCYFPRVVQNKDYLLQVMSDFTENEVIASVPLDSFVIDYMLVSETPDQGVYSNLKVYVVEINPFAEFAGEGLFSWVTEKGILKGKEPFEFRVVESEPEGAINTIDKEWSDFIKGSE